MQEVPRRPSIDQIDAEITRRRYTMDFRKAILTMARVLVVVAAITVLLAMLWLPILRIYGDSMAPTLGDMDVVVSVKTGDLARGEIIAFYYNNKILVKRVMAVGGDQVIIDDQGAVYVNGEKMEEPYLLEQRTDKGDLTYPIVVPEGFAFVLGDNRGVSLDSRYEEIGMVSADQIVGRVIWQVWPLGEMGSVE